ncbi:MAG: secretin N-terminal domain-containing protein [Crinalium sp.]
MRQLQKLGGICIGGIVGAISGQPGWAGTTPVTPSEVNLIPTNLEIKSKSSAVEVDSKNFSLIPTSATQTAKDDEKVGVEKSGSRAEDYLKGVGFKSKENLSQEDLLNKGQLSLKTSGETTFSAYQLPPAFNQGLSANSTKLAQTPIPTPSQTTPFPVRPDVLVPNPEIRIEGNPAPAAGSFQPVAPTVPLLPRAIAPPVGDISVSNINAASEGVDLGTTARVPKLVLKDAPVREVLELLARSAGLNLAFSLGNAGAATGGAPGAPGAPGTTGGLAPISLNLENEPVQEVFNYVLALSGLQANRIGRTLFVGTQLPQGVRNIIVRTLRLNQVTAGQAAGFLLAQGAEQQQVTTVTSVTGVTDPTTGIVQVPVNMPLAKITNTTNSVATQVATAVDAQSGGQPPRPSGALLLKGLAVTTDERLNAITLIGEPRKVELASAFLTQLDMRKRQVAVNVKIVDVNLLGIDQFNSSFSFGAGGGFFTVDNGAAVFNYGGVRPPTAAQSASSTISPAVITNPFAGASVFLDPNNPISVPGTIPGTIRIDENGRVARTEQRGAGLFPRPFTTIGDPLSSGIVSITPATDNIITVTRDADGNLTTATSQGTNGSITTALPSLFQFPKKFLSLLQAQITSGNAKILTDPTLVIQEGERAVINLSQEVLGGFRTTYQVVNNVSVPTQEPIIKNAGLILDVQVSRIDDNGFVTLNVNPTISAPASSAATPQGNITLLQQRTAQSGQLRLRDGQTLIMSGIIQETDQTTVTKVPILGDIPILGALFRSTNRQNQRNEVIVLLTPQIMDDSNRSSFGYNYNPSTEVRQILQQTGSPTPR